MKISEKQNPNFLLAFTCSILSHNYVMTKKITNHISEYTCKNCGKEVSNNIQGHLEELTPRRKEVNKTVSNYFIKRRKKNLTQLTA